jgi:hypothetical protein
LLSTLIVLEPFLGLGIEEPQSHVEVFIGLESISSVQAVYTFVVCDCRARVQKGWLRRKGCGDSSEHDVGWFQEL